VEKWLIGSGCLWVVSRVGRGMGVLDGGPITRFGEELMSVCKYGICHWGPFINYVMLGGKGGLSSVTLCGRERGRGLLLLHATFPTHPSLSKISPYYPENRWIIFGLQRVKMG